MGLKGLDCPLGNLQKNSGLKSIHYIVEWLLGQWLVESWLAAAPISQWLAMDTRLHPVSVDCTRFLVKLSTAPPFLILSHSWAYNWGLVSHPGNWQLSEMTPEILLPALSQSIPLWPEKSLLWGLGSCLNPPMVMDTGPDELSILTSDCLFAFWPGVHSVLLPSSDGSVLRLRGGLRLTWLPPWLAWKSDSTSSTFSGKAASKRDGLS